MYHSLHTSLSLLSESVALLESSNKSLRAATADIPRIRNVLLTKRVFALVPETDLAHAKSAFREQTSPKLHRVMAKIDTSMARLRKRKVALQNRHDLQHVRLQSGRRDPVAALVAKHGEDDPRVAKLRFLRNKRERLTYSLARMRNRKKEQEK